MYSLLNNFDIAYELMELITNNDDRLSMAIIHPNCAEAFKRTISDDGFDIYSLSRLCDEGFVNVFAVYLPWLKHVLLHGSFITFKASHVLNQLKSLTELTLTRITLNVSDIYSLCGQLTNLQKMTINHDVEYTKSSVASINSLHVSIVHIKKLSIKYVQGLNMLVERCVDLQSIILFNVMRCLIEFLPIHKLIDKNRITQEIHLMRDYFDIESDMHGRLQVRSIQMELYCGFAIPNISCVGRYDDCKNIRYINVINTPFTDTARELVGLVAEQNNFTSVLEIRFKRIHLIKDFLMERIDQMFPILNTIQFIECTVTDILGDFFYRFNDCKVLRCIRVVNTKFNRTSYMPDYSINCVKELFVINSIRVLEYGKVFSGVETLTLSIDDDDDFRNTIPLLLNYPSLCNLRLDRCSFSCFNDTDINLFARLRLKRLYVNECRDFNRVKTPIMHAFNFLIHKPHKFYA